MRAREHGPVLQRSPSDDSAGTIELNTVFEYGPIPAEPKGKRPPSEEHQFRITRPGRVYILCAQNLPVGGPTPAAVLAATRIARPRPAEVELAQS